MNPAAPDAVLFFAHNQAGTLHGCHRRRVDDDVLAHVAIGRVTRQNGSGYRWRSGSLQGSALWGWTTCLRAENRLALISEAARVREISAYPFRGVGALS